MSLLFFDGFDGYDSVADTVTYGGWACGWQPAFPALTSTVRVGTGKAFVMTTEVGWDKYFARNFASDEIANTVYIGFAFNPINLHTNTAAILQFTAGASNTGNVHCSIIYDGVTKVLLLYGPAGTLLATGTTAIPEGSTVYVEVKINIHDSTGVCEVKVEGVTQFTYSGDTKNVTDTFLCAAFVGGINAPWAIDDVYILNSAGTTNNTYLGEQRCEIITPTSDSSVAWTRNTGASNFSAVDDTIGAPDDDTTYVSSSTSAQKDEYGLSDLTVIATVAGVKLITRAEKDDANPLSLKTGIKSGATDQQVTHALGVGYANFVDIFETSDGVNTAFTQTTVNSLLSTIQIP
jgi:hypothetical protein